MIKSFILNVSGVVKFDDEDRSVEEFLIKNQYNSAATEAIDKAIQELREEASSVHFSMIRIDK